MEPPSLLIVCVASFTTVFVMLGLLAVTMRVLTTVFPERVADSDTAMIAAVTAAASARYPGSRITKVEERK